VKKKTQYNHGCLADAVMRLDPALMFYNSLKLNVYGPQSSGYVAVHRV
jgi:hypothetical protein